MTLGRRFRARYYCPRPTVILGGLAVLLPLFVPDLGRADLTGVELIPVVEMVAPVDIGGFGDGSDRLIVADNRGFLFVVLGGVVDSQPILDIEDRVVCCGEQGLAAFAVHPEFPATPHLYALYTSIEPPILEHRNSVLSRFTWDEERSTFDAASEKVVLRVAQPAPNHNGNDLEWGPDGMLYVATGDGGGQGDKFGNGQNGAVFNGKILRIDPDGGDPYAVPNDNPFVGDPSVLDEIWALGLRNPWRIGFDRSTGDLWIADAGQERWEEANRVAPGTSGANFGWSEMEGDECHQPGCDPGLYDPPEVTYCHGNVDGCPTFDDCAIVGARRYRGHTAPGLIGRVVLVDFCSGRVRVARELEGGWEVQALYDGEELFWSLGEDDRGELYVLSSDGWVYRLQGLPSGFADGFESGGTTGWSQTTP